MIVDLNTERLKRKKETLYAIDVRLKFNENMEFVGFECIDVGPSGYDAVTKALFEAAALSLCKDKERVNGGEVNPIFYGAVLDSKEVCGFSVPLTAEDFLWIEDTFSEYLDGYLSEQERKNLATSVEALLNASGNSETS